MCNRVPDGRDAVPVFSIQPAKFAKVDGDRIPMMGV